MYKIHELQQYANSLENSPDIIALTEIKYKNKWQIDIFELNIDGYRLFNNDLQSCNRGIIVYVKDNINCKQILLNNSFTEYTLLELKLQTNKVVLQRCIDLLIVRKTTTVNCSDYLTKYVKKKPVTNYL